jgi:Tfp pilus assembly protein PilW
MVCKTISTKTARRHRITGLGLVEAMIAIGITALLILVLTNVSMLSGRMFASFFNYVDLDDANRIAMDTLTRDLRECNRVTSCSTTQLVIEDSDGFSVTYSYNPGATPTPTLTRTKAGIPRILLKGCDALTFNLGTRNPIGGTFEVVPTTDVSLAKVVNVSWNCSRTILGKKANTENVQTARIVIRRQGS